MPTGYDRRQRGRCFSTLINLADMPGADSPMIVNAYAVLDASLSLLRLLVGLLIIGIGITAWRMWQPGLAPERRTALEDRTALLFLLAFLLLGLNLVAWP